MEFDINNIKSNQELIMIINKQLELENILDIINNSYISEWNNNYKKRRENILEYWLIKFLEKLLTGIFNNSLQVELKFNPEINWLFYKRKHYIWVYINKELKIIINIKYIYNNLSWNFTKIFEDLIINNANVKTKGIEYMNLLVLPEKVPFINNWVLQKYESFNLQYLAKITNITLDPNLNISNNVIIVNKNLSWNEGNKKESIKTLKIKPSNLKYLYNDLIPSSVIDKITETIVKRDLYDFLKVLTFKIKNKIIEGNQSSNQFWWKDSNINLL